MEVEQFCDLDDVGDNPRNRDYVRWQSSQPTCSALNSLITEAARSRSPHHQYNRDGLLRKERTEARWQRSPLASTSFSSSSSSSPTCSSSSSSSLFAVASSSSYSSTSSVITSHPNSKHSIPASRQRRSRPLRPSASASCSPSSTLNTNPNADPRPPPDPTVIVHMCKAISKHVDEPIRGDGVVAAPSKEPRKTALLNKRKQQLAVPSRGGKVKSRFIDGSVMANADRKRDDKGKARALDSDSDVAVVHHLDRDLDKMYSANTLEKSDYMAEANPCPSSAEVMPPPPLPVHVQAQMSTTTHLPNPVVQQDPIMTSDKKTCATSMVVGKITVSHTNEPPPSSLPSHTTLAKPRESMSMVKLHPLLDPIRQQRRAKLTRTISASLALDSQSQSLKHTEPVSKRTRTNNSAPPSPPSTSATHAWERNVHPEVAPQQMQGRSSSSNQSLSRLHPQHSTYATNSHAATATNSNANSIPSRVQSGPPPPLGMRRTHGFPLASQNQISRQEVNLNRGSKADVNGSVGPKMSAGAGLGGVALGLPVKAKSFKPPLLPKDVASYPSTGAVRSSVGSSKQEVENKKTMVTRRNMVVDTDVDMDANDSNMTDDRARRAELDTASDDADISFGDAFSFDVDMDALEETMRKYD